MKEVKAVFKIDQSFNLSVGIVVSGHFIEGYPLIGYNFVVDIDGKPAAVKITGVQRGNLDSEGKMLWGLLLHFDDPALGKIAETNRIKVQVVEIFAGL